MLLDDRKQSFRFLLHDRDSKFGGGFDQILRSEGMTIVRTPVRAPNANAYAERWIGTLRRECLDRILIVNRRQLERVLRVYAAHYNRHRPHRSLSLQPPDGSASAAARAPAGASANTNCWAASSTNTKQPRDPPPPMTEFRTPRVDSR
jgi:transposase InsO family protein